jgi:hypothetical protein
MFQTKGRHIREAIRYQSIKLHCVIFQKSVTGQTTQCYIPEDRRYISTRLQGVHPRRQKVPIYQITRSTSKKTEGTYLPDYKEYLPEDGRYLSTRRFTSKKTVIFVVTSLRTSNSSLVSLLQTTKKLPKFPCHLLPSTTVTEHSMDLQTRYFLRLYTHIELLKQ